MCYATDVSGGRISRPASHRVYKTPICVSRVRWEGEEEGGDKREVAPGDAGAPSAAAAGVAGRARSAHFPRVRTSTHNAGRRRAQLLSG